MKKAKVFFLLFILYSFNSFGQLLPLSQSPYPRTFIATIKQPLLLIGSLETNRYSLVIDPANLEVIKTYTDSVELAAFGEKGRNGIIVARLKNKTPLLRLDEVLDYYKIPPANRTLKVLLNKSLIHPDLFLADVNRIQKVEIVKQDLTSVMRYSWDKDELFLNIVTMKD